MDNQQAFGSRLSSPAVYLENKRMDYKINMDNFIVQKRDSESSSEYSEPAQTQRDDQSPARTSMLYYCSSIKTSVKTISIRLNLKKLDKKTKHFGVKDHFSQRSR